MQRNTSKQRVRKRPINRWTDVRTADLLNMVLRKINGAPELFEKPTKRAFYQAVAKMAPSLCTLDWSLIANKIRNLRVIYAEAKSLRDAAADIDQWNELDIEEQIMKKCPFYEQLDIIYGSRKSRRSDKDETSLGYDGNFEVDEDDGDEKEYEEEEEEEDKATEPQSRAVESFESNCSDTLLALLKDDSAELDNVKEEQEEVELEECEELMVAEAGEEEQEAANPVLFENILISNQFEAHPNRVPKPPSWRDKQTKALLESALHVIEHDAGAYQKCTQSAQSFYEKLLARCSELRHLDWTVARGKMAKLRASYAAAGALLKQQTGVQRLDDEALNEEIHRVCPFFDLLHRIFGREKRLEMIESTRAVIKSDVNEIDEEQRQQSSESEDEYPFEDEEEVCMPTKATKPQRLHLKPNHSWTKKATEKLLSNILKETNANSEAFENPTAQTFYRRVFPQVNWQLCRSKMGNMRKTYKLAHAFRDQNSRPDKEEEDWVREKVLKICPYFGLISQIFNPRSATFPVETLDYKGEQYEVDGGDNEEEGDAICPPPATSKNSSTTSACLARPVASKMKKMPNERQPKKRKAVPDVEEKAEDEDEDEDEQAYISEAPQPTRDSSSLWAFRKEQLKLEREKVVSDLEIRKLELQHEFDIRKLEVERDERLALAKLKFEMEERVKKYELELKLRNNLGYLNL